MQEFYWVVLVNTTVEEGRKQDWAEQEADLLCSCHGNLS